MIGTLDSLIINFIMQHRFGPLFAPLIRVDEESDQPYIMAVDINGTTIKWNKKHTIGWPISHLFTVLGHEIGHLIAHVGTPAKVLGQYYKPGQDRYWDLACEIFADCFAIHTLGLKIIPIMQESKERIAAINRFKDYTTKEIYEELKKMPDEQFEKLYEPYLGNGLDIVIIQGHEGKSGDDDSSSNGIDISTLLSVLKSIEQLSHGTLPGELQTLLQRITYTKVDISRRLSLWLKNAAIGSAFDFKRIEPRYYTLHRVIVPGLGGRELKLLFALDGSGSTSPYFRKFLGIAKHNLSVFPRLNVDVVCFDVEIYHQKHITRMNLSELDEIPYRAGGTAFNDVLQYAHDHGFRNVLILTDGDGELDPSLTEGLNILWAIYTDIKLYPGAEIIRIHLEDD